MQDGIFYVLNCTNARRSAKAAVSIAVDMVKSKIISEQEGITRIDPMHMMYYLRPQLVASFRKFSRIDCTLLLLKMCLYRESCG